MLLINTYLTETITIKLSVYVLHIYASIVYNLSLYLCVH